MLEAPVTKPKEATATRRSAVELELPHELFPPHAGLQVQTGAAFDGLSQRPRAGRNFAGPQRQINNPAVLGMPFPRYRSEPLSPRGPLLQRKCACGGSGGECASCKEKREESLLQRKTNGAAVNRGLPPIVHEVLRSPGQPLDARTRTFFEPRFGQDFSHVRVHADEPAARSARSVNALAYTVGRELVFGAGQYTPSSPAGQRLLAHELTHVMQQSRQGSSGSSVHIDDSPKAENEADRMADRVLSGQTPRHPFSDRPSGLQRQAAPQGPVDAGQTNSDLEDPMYPLVAACVAPHVCDVSGGVPDASISQSCWKQFGREGRGTIELTKEDCTQYFSRTVLREDRVKLLSVLLVEYRARQAAGKLTEGEVTRIRDAIDYQAIPALDRAGVGRDRINKALNALPDPRLVLALSSPVTDVELTLQFARLTAEGGLAAAESAEVAAVAATAIEGGAGTATAATATAGGLALADVIPPLLLAIAVTALILYITSLPEPRVDRLAPELLEKAIDTLRRQLEYSRQRDIETAKKAKTETKPSPEPFPLPPLKPAPEEQKKKCRPTGITPGDPIPMLWFKPPVDTWYLRSIKIADGTEYNREDEPTVLPKGERIGVDKDYWPSLGKPMRLYYKIPEEDKRPGAERFKRTLARYGFDWRKLSPDHVQDIAWEGPDNETNLWPMWSEANSLAGTCQDNHRVKFCLTEEGPPLEMSIREMREAGLLRHFFIAGYGNLLNCK